MNAMKMSIHQPFRSRWWASKNRRFMTPEHTGSLARYLESCLQIHVFAFAPDLDAHLFADPVVVEDGRELRGGGDRLAFHRQDDIAWHDEIALAHARAAERRRAAQHRHALHPDLARHRAAQHVVGLDV